MQTTITLNLSGRSVRGSAARAAARAYAKAIAEVDPIAAKKITDQANHHEFIALRKTSK